MKLLILLGIVPTIAVKDLYQFCITSDFSALLEWLSHCDLGCVSSGGVPLGTGMQGRMNFEVKEKV